MNELRVEIVRYVDDHQPGWIECEFVDAEGKCHTVVDKVPIFGTETNENLDATNKYPQPGFMQCQILERWKDSRSRELVRVSTAPYGVETKEGLSEFVVLSAQLSASTNQ